MSKTTKKLLGLVAAGVAFSGFLGGCGGWGWLTQATLLAFGITGTLDNLGVLAG